jgi:hypothetical protein
MSSNFYRVKKGLRIDPVNGASTASEKGSMDVTDSNGKLNYNNGSSTSPVVTEAHSATLTNKTIDGDDNTIQDVSLNSLKTELADADKFLVRDANGVVISNTKAVPTGDIVGDSDTQTLTNKTIDGDDNTVQDLGLGTLKTDLTDANKFLNRDASGNVVSDEKAVPTGDVVGSSDTQTLTNKTIDGDDNTIQDLGLSSIKTELADADKFISRNNSGAVISGPNKPTGDVVGTSDTQTLSNKTIDGDNNTISNIDLPSIKPVLADANKILVRDGAGVVVSGSGSLPSGDVVGTNDTQTLTNKTIDGDDNTLVDISLTSLKTEAGDANKFLSRDGSGAVISGPNKPTGDVVGDDDTQTLTNKTIDGASNTISGLLHGTQVDNPSSGVHGVTGSVVGTTDTQTLTNKTLQSAVISQKLNLQATTDATSTGVDATLATQVNVHHRLTNGSLDSVAGITDPLSKSLIILTNATGAVVALRNESVAATGDNRIITGTGADLALEDEASVILIYDDITNRWRVVGGSGSGGGGGANIILNGGTLSGSYSGDVICLGDASLAADVNITGSLYVVGSLTRSNSLARELIIRGDLHADTVNVSIANQLPTRLEVEGSVYIKGVLDQVVGPNAPYADLDGSFGSSAVSDWAAEGVTVGDYIRITSGPLKGQRRKITGIINAGLNLSVHRSFGESTSGADFVIESNPANNNSFISLSYAFGKITHHIKGDLHHCGIILSGSSASSPFRAVDLNVDGSVICSQPEIVTQITGVAAQDTTSNLTESSTINIKGSCLDTSINVSGTESFSSFNAGTAGMVTIGGDFKTTVTTGEKANILANGGYANGSGTGGRAGDIIISGDCVADTISSRAGASLFASGNPIPSTITLSGTSEVVGINSSAANDSDVDGAAGTNFIFKGSSINITNMYLQSHFGSTGDARNAGSLTVDSGLVKVTTLWAYSGGSLGGLGGNGSTITIKSGTLQVESTLNVNGGDGTTAGNGGSINLQSPTASLYVNDTLNLDGGNSVFSGVAGSAGTITNRGVIYISSDLLMSPGSTSTPTNKSVGDIDNYGDLTVLGNLVMWLPVSVTQNTVRRLRCRSGRVDIKTINAVDDGFTAISSSGTGSCLLTVGSFSGALKKLSNSANTVHIDVGTSPGTKLFKTNPQDGSWVVMGEGADSGGINYINNPDAESNVVGWATYADAAAAVPVDGTGGSPNVTWTRNTTTPLRGAADFLFTKDAANRQGQGVGDAFTIDRADQATVLRISFDYISSANYADGDVRVYIYDVTNALVIELSKRDLDASSFGKYIGEFQTASNSTSYRLILHVASTNASAYTINADNFVVGPREIARGPMVTDWQSYTLNIGATTTAPTKGTVAVDTARWRRVGDSMEVYYTYRQSAGGSAGSGTYLFPLPTGYSVDTSKISLQGGAGDSQVGFGRVASTTADAANYNTQCTVILFNSTSVALQTAAGGGGPDTVGQVRPVTSFWFQLSGVTSYSFNYRVPILGWSSNQTISSDFGGRLISLEVSRASSSQVITASTDTKILFNSTSGNIDTVAGWSTANSEYTIQESGEYEINPQLCFQAVAGAGAGDIRIKKGSSNIRTQYWSYPNITDTGVSPRFKIDLVKGDVISVWMTTTQGMALLSGGSIFGGSRLSIKKLATPQTLAGGEKVLASYTTNFGASVPSAATRYVDFEDKEIDTHGIAVNVGSGLQASSANGFGFVAPRAGTATVDVSIGYAIQSWLVGQRVECEVRKNGSIIIANVMWSHDNNTLSLFPGSLSPQFSVNKGDLIQVSTYQTNGANRTLITSGAYNRFSFRME